jgi:REase_DpnII-MboI
VKKSKEKLLIEKRLILLAEFAETLRKHFNAEYEGENEPEMRLFINRNLVAVRAAIREAGTLKLMNLSPPPAVGGAIMQHVDPFENLFGNFYGMSLIPTALDCIEQAIGVYEYMQTDESLLGVSSREVIDVETAIERALRPSFHTVAPQSERDVQNAVETILRAVGVEFTRDREVAPVGAKAFRPDFIIEMLDLAIEVKLTKPSRSAADIQEEIAADIAAYRTKWRHLLIVIYDLGSIDDPYQMRKSNLKHFGVSVIVIKQ